MNITRFIEPETKTQTYLIYSTKNNAVILDPVDVDCDKYLDAFKKLNLKLLYAIDTHIHADHVTASGLLRKKTGCKIVMGVKANLNKVDINLEDNQELKFDDITIKALYTPGHTVESYCYLINNRLFTGDCLLINGCGRTDFQNGSAQQQYHSLFDKLLTLPEETLVYPAHDYNNRTISTIGEEKRNNPRLQVKDIKAFEDLMNNLNLPRPKYMDIAVPKNLKCGEE